MQKQIAHRPFRHHTFSIAIISPQTRGIYRIHIWELKTTLSVIYFNVLLRTGIPFIEALIYGHLASNRTLQHSCHWWWKCCGDMVSEVNHLLVAGTRNLTHTTHVKKNIFCHMLISGFRSGFRHFPVEGFDYCHQDLISLFLGPIPESITIPQGCETLAKSKTNIQSCHQGWGQCH